MEAKVAVERVLINNEVVFDRSNATVTPYEEICLIGGVRKQQKIHLLELFLCSERSLDLQA
jgi:hypothetical protein